MDLVEPTNRITVGRELTAHAAFRIEIHGDEVGQSAGRPNAFENRSRIPRTDTSDEKEFAGGMADLLHELDQLLIDRGFFLDHRLDASPAVRLGPRDFEDSRLGDTLDQYLQTTVFQFGGPKKQRHAAEGRRSRGRSVLSVELGRSVPTSRKEQITPAKPCRFHGEPFAVFSNKHRENHGRKNDRMTQRDYGKFRWKGLFHTRWISP
jgi:hypothetical protein